MNIHVKPRESLWSIAAQALPKGASKAAIQSAVEQIARANGLAPTAQLQVGQALTVPDRLAATVTSDPEVAGSLGRLTDKTAGVPATRVRLGSKAAPLVDLKPVFSPTSTKADGPVHLGDVAGLKLQGTVLRMQGVASSSLGASALQSVEARLGPLTQAQFDAVKQELGGRSNVVFDAARSYTVADFLPPALQALLLQDLEVAEPIKLKGTKGLGEDMGSEEDRSVGLTMNCHATAWEAMRAYQAPRNEVAVFYGEMVTMDGMTSDAARFDTVAELKAAQVGDLATLPLRPGDVVQFHEESDWARMTMLLHSAVYVGGGLFFEKPNTEGAEKADPANYVTQDETPFRLATPSMMAEPISHAVEGKFRMVVLRPKAPLPDPAEAFALSYAKDVNAWASKKGRALGVELVSEMEQGMGGNIRAEHPAALVRVPLREDAAGLASLKA